MSSSKKAIIPKPKISQIDKKLQRELKPGFLYRIYRDIDPTVSLGAKATKDIDKSYRKIVAILIIFFLLSVLSTILFFLVKDKKQEGQLSVALLSLTWFVFVSFLFLIFESTKLLNIIILISILAVVANIITGIEDKDSAAYIISIIILTIASISVSFLLVYFSSSNKSDEVVQIMTRAREEEKRKQLAELIKSKIKETEENVREKLKGEMQSEEGVRRVIANAAIEGLVDNAKKGFKAPQQKKKSKKKEDKKEDEE